MNKEQQIEEIMLTIPQKIVAYNGDPKGQHLYGEQRLQIAEVLYNAGYRKVPSGCGLVETNAVKEFAERIKLETTVDNRLCVREYDIGYNDGYSEAYYGFHKIIDGLLKEYENDYSRS